MTDNAKLKLSESRKGIKFSDETKLKLSEAHKGKQNRSIKIEYNGKTYGCKKELYFELGISKKTFRKRFAQGLYGIEIEK